jgi:glycosyltransferase involved in cell wall biosynthesis
MQERIFGTLDPFHEPGPILGRRVANEGFLRALLTVDPFDRYHFFLADQRAADGLEAFLGREFPALSASGRLAFPHRLTLARALAETDYFCFHQSDCIRLPALLARARNAFSRTLFPITSLTHSLNYADYGQAFLKHLWPGTTPRDAIVATSGSGAGVVRRFFDALREGYGLSLEAFPAPRVERIPLGLDPAEFPPVTGAERERARKRLRLPPGQIALLVLGRIQHHSKMDLLPLFSALRRLYAQGLARDRVRVILAGWTDEGDDLPETLARLAASIGLPLDLVIRPDAARKRELLAASDVFVSIADNPQETFGITLLEAQAAGLPVIASDYDGYRDLVIHEETGLLVPTLGPRDTRDLDALAPLFFDNQYHLLLAQQTVVEVPELAEALSRLIGNGELRAGMGAAGREWAEAEFFWPAIVARYVALWEELARAPVDEGAARAAAHPLSLAYGRIFGGYPTQRLSPELRLAASALGRAVYQGREFPVLYAGLEDVVDEAALKHLLYLARKPVNAGDLAARMAEWRGSREPERFAAPELAQARAEALVLWAFKQDHLERA